MNRTTRCPESRTLPVRRALLGLLAASLFAATTVAAADPPSLRHTFFMRGQIVEVQDASVVVCIGHADGATVGQELDVVRHRRVSTGTKGMGRFRREVIGKVRINAIVDEHYAEASVISGSAGQHDSVELAALRE